MHIRDAMCRLELRCLLALLAVVLRAMTDNGGPDPVPR
jgi:hypothetical protein